MKPILERSKLCLDFSCTMYVIHFLFCLEIGGLESTLKIVPIILLVSSCAITVYVGRYACQQSELLPIPIGLSAAAAASSVTGGARLRSCLPIINRLVAKFIGIFKGSSPEIAGNDTIPLTKVPSLAVVIQKI